ncbi:Rrf2 family transcriptional regulator [Prauserella alba]|uniref:Rrf2 family transcriptional regulator n=1 Tax=Prauserella alba TaxID=176898 RepID=A0ABP4G0P6_9PSEU
MHALAFLAQWQGGELRSSQAIAESLDSNPAFVRRVLGRLRERGLVVAVEGAAGGWRLAKPAEEITLRDVHAVADDGAVPLPVHAHPPNRNCVIGRHMLSLLESEFADAQRAMEERLAQTSIADLLGRVYRSERAEEAARGN